MNTELQIVRDLDVVAAEIRSFTASMLVNIIEIGRRMTEAKSILPHGEFLPWLKEKTGYSSSTANNFMRLYEEYGADQGSLFGAELNCQTFGNLTYSKALALLSVPKDEREAFVQENNVDDLSTRQLQELIKERDAAIRRAEEAEEKFREADETADALLKEADRWAEKVKELEKRPQEIVVENDPAAIDAAVQDALEKAKKQYDVELEKMRKKLEDGEKKAEILKRQAEEAQSKAEQAKKDAEGLASASKKAAEEEATKWEMEAQRLRKELAMADPVTAEFKGLFSSCAELVSKMVLLVKQASEDSAPKLRAGMVALADQLRDA